MTKLPPFTPEILAPVGQIASAYAAIAAGANAIYVGFPHFNARGRTKDHSLEELEVLIDTSHLYGVKVYLALNVLIFENEIPEVISLLEKIMPLGPDALIVQDLGLCQVISQLYPHFPLHGSTQMTVTSPEAIQLLADLPLKRFVLARENSLEEMRQIRAQTNKELEVFVHGALCVAYSGQCLTSESIGGRSANRGQCAQSCRLSYDMLVDGQKKELADKAYLLSPHDLSALDEVAELQAIGINCFKIEGRLKGADYVGQSTWSYRQAVEANSAHQKVSTEELKQLMALTYSRGFYSGWMHGVNHQRLVEGKHNAHIGLEVGKIISLNQGKLRIRSSFELLLGDGVLIERATSSVVPTSASGGGVITYREKLGDDLYEIRIKTSESGLQELNVNDTLFLNSRPSLGQHWQQKLNLHRLREIAIDIKLTIDLFGMARIEVRDDQNHVIQKDFGPLTQAKQAPDQQFISDLLSSTGHTPFVIKNFSYQSAKAFWISEKMLKQWRREILSELSQQRIQKPSPPKKKSVVSSNSPGSPLIPTEYAQPQPQSQSQLHFLLRSFEQIHALKKLIASHPEFRCQIGPVTLDLEHGMKIAEGLELLKESALAAGVATTRIFKSGENRNLKVILNAGPTHIVARNLGALQWLRAQDYRGEMIGDFSLNAVNSKSAHYLMSKGLTRLMPGMDLNAQQLWDMLQHFPASKLELPLQWYLSSFHMEHCVFAAFLSKGKDWRDCGRPCEKHQVQLIDQFGHAHFLHADHECRNTMYNAIAQSGLGLVCQFQIQGGRHLRLEFLEESGEIFYQKAKAYLQLFTQQIDQSQLKAKLGRLESFGIGQGQFFRPDHYQDRKQ